MYYVYVVIENKRFFQNYFQKDKIDGMKMLHFPTPFEFIKNDVSFNNLIILWHISGSLIKENALNSYKEQIDSKYKNKIILKIGKSESNQYLNTAEPLKWFDILEKGTNIENYFKECRWDTATILENALSFKTQLFLNKAYIEYFQRFLSLDIDMQTLEILWNDNKRKDAVKCLKEMFSDIEAGFFLNKFNETKKLIEQIPEGDNKNELKDLLRIDEGGNSYICKFLMLLDNKKKECVGLTEQDVQDVISYFSNSEHKTFHDWYWELSKSDVQ